MTPLEKAVELVGGQSELARRIGVSQSTISDWIAQPGRRRAIGQAPGKYTVAISQATGGIVTPEMLRPDLFE